MDEREIRAKAGEFCDRVGQFVLPSDQTDGGMPQRTADLQHTASGWLHDIQTLIGAAGDCILGDRLQALRTHLMTLWFSAHTRTGWNAALHRARHAAARCMLRDPFGWAARRHGGSDTSRYSRSSTSSTDPARPS